MANEIGYWNATPASTSNPSSGAHSHTAAAHLYTAGANEQISEVRAMVGESVGSGDGPEYFIACRRTSDDEIMFSTSIGTTESAGVLEELSASVSWTLVNGVEYALILSILAADSADVFIGYDASANTLARHTADNNLHTVGQTWTTDLGTASWDVVFAGDVTSTSGTSLSGTSESFTVVPNAASVSAASGTAITATHVSKTLSTTDLSLTFNTNTTSDSKSVAANSATVYIGSESNLTALPASRSTTTYSATIQLAGITLGFFRMGAFRYTLSADGTTPIQMARGRTRLKLSGTFGSGTAQLQERDASGSWVNVANGSFTDVTDTVFDFPYGPVNRLRVDLSGSTSPALVVQLDSQ